MSKTTFLRAIEADDKGELVRSAVSALRSGGEAGHDAVFERQQEDFDVIDKSPFAYWATGRVRQLFESASSSGEFTFDAQHGLSTKEDFRFLRLWWEVPPHAVIRPHTVAPMSSAELASWCSTQFSNGERWGLLAKGGEFSHYYSDLYIVVNWRHGGGEIATRLLEKYPYIKNNLDWVLHRECSYYFPGITWSARSNKGLSFRCFPAGSLFASKGPVVFGQDHRRRELLAVLNSDAFRRLVEMQMAFGSYEVGVIQRTPVPNLDHPKGIRAGELATTAVAIKQTIGSTNEISHLFARPALLQQDGKTLSERLTARSEKIAALEGELAAIQSEIDDLAYALYGLSDEDRHALEAALPSATNTSVEDLEDGEEDEADVDKPVDPSALAHGLVSYALGCAVGRWDVRYATGERTAPPLPDPFAPLPVCSPGMLQGDDGLPLATPPAGYPLTVDADGLLVDDEDHPDDVVRHIRQVLAVCFDDAEAIEVELCGLLGERSLRGYLRRKGGFFADHTTRYSQKPRKAPVYWYLRSAKGSYGLWVYLHRLDGDTLFKALENYVLPKIQLEQNRLEGLRAERVQAGTSGRDAKRVEKALDAQEALLSELEDFRDALKRAADLRLVPDLDDGVVLTIAPLSELVPWSEPARYWAQLLKGDYAWSTVGRQLREKGLDQDAR